jgi:cytochrome P450
MASETWPTRSIAELPGPRGLPLIGNAHQLVPVSGLHQRAERWARRYGPIFRVDVGRRRTVVNVSDPDEIHRILRERPDGFRRWRDQEIVAKEIAGRDGPAGVFIAEGEDWKRQRRLVISALNTNHLQRYFEVIRTSTERLHRRLFSAAAEGRPIEISRALTSFTVDTISALAFGHDLNTLERGEVELQRHIQRLLHMTARRLAAPVPYWRWVRLPADRALDRSNAALDGEVEGFIDQARRRMAARPELYEHPENLLEAMLAAQAQHADEHDGRFTDEEIIANARTIISAGEDTTAHTLGWTIWFLACHPGVQERLAQEAGELLGERPFAPDFATAGAPRYAEAVLRESLRLKTVGPLNPLEPLLDTTICDTHIPAGTPLLLLVRQANLRQQPAVEFDPQRWLGEDQTPASSSLVFGAGPRFCPGRNLALLEAKSALTMIARNFEIELDETAGPVREHFGFTMIPRGLRVRLRSRERAHRRSVPGARTGSPAAVARSISSLS